jgi:hypothetical protein
MNKEGRDECHTKNLGLFWSIPLQFLHFWNIPLLFIYLETCHYNSYFLWVLPFYTFDLALDPYAGLCTSTKNMYGRYCPCSSWVSPSRPPSESNRSPFSPPSPRTWAGAGQLRWRRHRRIEERSQLQAASIGGSVWPGSVRAWVPLLWLPGRSVAAALVAFSTGAARARRQSRAAMRQAAGGWLGVTTRIYYRRERMIKEKRKCISSYSRLN